MHLRPHRTLIPLFFVSSAVSELSSDWCIPSDTSSVAPSSTRKSSAFINACLCVTERETPQQMVLWPGLGQRDGRLHTSEEASAWSSLTCFLRCALHSAFCAARLHTFVLIFVFCRRFATCVNYSFADLRIVRSAHLSLDSCWWCTDIALLR